MDGCPKNDEEEIRRRENLIKDLIPNYSLGCKRMLVSDDFFYALTDKRVELITDEIQEFT
jgi:hypothetical protein